MAERILLVEDEENLRETIKLNLELEGYEVAEADTGPKALTIAGEQRFNLVILDVMLPGMNGFSVCSNLRARDAGTPILFLTAKSEHEDKIKGFKTGADDYMTKPFNLEELLLRVKVLVKRNGQRKKEDKQMNTYRFGKNEIDFVKHKAKAFNGLVYELTKKEVLLLKLLIENKDSVVSRQSIMEIVWEYDVYPTTRSVDNFILIFRRRFEADPRNPKYFHSIRGIGYKFTN